MVRQFCEIETNIVSAERVKEYTEIAQEAPQNLSDRTPAASWPEQGVVTFDAYATRYRDGLPNVIDGLDLVTKPNEKIGIVKIFFGHRSEANIKWDLYLSNNVC